MYVILKGGVRYVFGTVESATDGLHDVEETDTSGEKVGNSDLVGSVESAKSSTAGEKAIAGEPEGGVTDLVDLRESQRRKVGPRKGRAGSAQALGKRQGVRDRNVHIGQAELSLQGPVLELDHRVDNRLRVEKHVNLFGRKAKQPMGLDNLETLVNQSCRIDSDLRAHRPVGVGEGLSSGNGAEFGERNVAKSAAGSSEDDAPERRRFTDKALEDGGVLGVDRNDGNAVEVSKAHNQLAGNDEALLISQSDFLTSLDSANGGKKPGVTDKSVNGNVDITGSPGSSNGILTGENLDGQV